MRLNRVLLLAAVISMAMAAMVFTISCSGDDGKDGSSCTAERKGDEGYSIKCGGVEQGFIPFTGVKGDKGDKGDDGANCTWVAGVTFNCDGHTVNLGGTGGGGAGCQIGKEDPYNENELVIQCPGAESIYLCAGYAFDPKVTYCYNGQDRNQDVNLANYNRPAASAFGYQALLLDTISFPCELSAGAYTYYNPNKFFCTATGSPEKLTELCGGGDFSNTYRFCLRSNFDAVVRKCGSTGLEFGPTQFCKVIAVADSTAAGGTFVGAFVPRLYNSTGADTATLCGGAQYGAAGVIKTDNATKEITGLTGGEYYPSSAPAGLAKLINASVGSRYYYASGSQVCSNGKVLTKCARAASGTTPASDTLLFDASKEFCRTSSTDITKLEAAPLCYKTGTTIGGTRYDDVNYFCNPNTGNPGKKCQAEYYDEAEEFCYPDQATGVKVPYCKDDDASSRVYDPATKFCSYQKPASKYTAASLQKQTPFCGTLKFNEGSWKWQYCISNGTGANTIYRIQTCLLNQDIADTTNINTGCKCNINFAMHPGTGQCTLPLNWTLGSSAAIVETDKSSGINLGGGTATAVVSCPGNSVSAVDANYNVTCACPAGYPWSAAKAECRSSNDCATTEAWDQYLGQPSCQTTCSGGAIKAQGVCTCPASHPWQAIPGVNSGNARCQTNTNGCPVGEAWDTTLSGGSPVGCVSYAFCPNNVTSPVPAGTHVATCP